MANEIRLRPLFQAGTVTTGLSGTDVLMTSPDLTTMPIVDATNHVAIVLNSDQPVGQQEVAYITAHAAAGNTATILRGQDTTLPRAVPQGAKWVCAMLPSDLYVNDYWRPAVFQNAWGNYGSGYSPGAYRKDAANFVHLRGLISLGTMGVSAFTLPAGYRPAFQSLFSVISNGAVGRTDVLTNGQVIPYNGTNVWTSLEGLTFLAEA